MARIVGTLLSRCVMTSRSRGHGGLLGAGRLTVAGCAARRTSMNWTRLNATSMLTTQALAYQPQTVRCISAVSRAAAAGTDEHASLSAVTITKTELDATSRRLHVTWNDGEQTSYPYIWLRDNCQSSQSFHASAMTRRLLFHDIDFNVMPQNVEINSSTQEVVLTWSDDHRSVFRYGWLLARSFRYAEQTTRARWNGRAAKLWKSNLADNVLNVKFDEFLADDRQLYNWLTALEETGFVMLTGVPSEQGQLHRIAARVAYLRKTILGETSFENTGQETSMDVSQTLGSIELHNDLTHYYNVPGMKMVHCISAGAPAADGSEKQVTQFVDGFQAAQQMKHEHPEQFRLLTSVKMDFFDGAHNAITMARHPTIKLALSRGERLCPNTGLTHLGDCVSVQRERNVCRLDESGEVVQIHYSTRYRDSFCRQSLEDVEPLYRALKTFSTLIYDPRNLVEMQLKAGVVYCFNNWRVLHGRKAFRLVPGSEPVFERGYIGWDELHSKRRMLKIQFEISDEDY